MTNKKAFLFDLNGTMVDDMTYHIKAWHRIMNDNGAGISLERMKAECYGKNEEVIERILPGKFSMAEKTAMGLAKEKQYQHEFRPYLQLLPGLNEFLQKAKQQHIKMAIGTAAIMSNVDFVLDGLNIRSYFEALISADEVTKSKPDPETYLLCAAQLHVAAEQCIVFEDAPKGVECAARAGMQAVVLTTMHEAWEFTVFDNVLMIINDYTDTKLAALFDAAV
ncbi:MAG TPA: HAD family phosphatase [Ferruginibacter sp.]|nr:HAD family phosphatase [Ferruginibacter sp.]HMP20437.1 HAD family phosphatase [Ferruginibacter sp.]